MRFTIQDYSYLNLYKPVFHLICILIIIRKRAQVTEMIIMVSLMLNCPFNIRDKVMVLE